MTEQDKMRAVADFMDAHPELPRISANAAVWVFDKEKIIAAARMPGAKKSYDDNSLTVTVPFEGGFLRFYMSREAVCTPTKIEKTWVEPKEGHYNEKVVEWDCHPLLAPTPEGQAIEAMVEDGTFIASDGSISKAVMD